MPHAATWNVSYLGAYDILVHTYMYTYTQTHTPKYEVLFLLQYIT